MLVAALRLWIDKGGSLAAAELARLLDYPDRPDDWLAAALSEPRGGAFMGASPVVELLERRGALSHAGMLQTLDAVISVGFVSA